jgi:hypothetical protein
MRTTDTDVTARRRSSWRTGGCAAQLYDDRLQHRVAQRPRRPWRDMAEERVGDYGASGRSARPPSHPTGDVPDVGVDEPDRFFGRPWSSVATETDVGLRVSLARGSSNGRDLRSNPVWSLDSASPLD